ncbi:hypothetical protein NSQ59_07405 [Margalitia sp. FSL K6-0131]|uniref:hypothetical protein n=1 Tax=Margalitia sp. FSL K6-0131 TaxID=2954604 RepID=UPI0030FBB38E
MTTVISLSNEYCSIIITDNRENYGCLGELGYEDGRTKLINIPDMGWVCGAGLADFLDLLKDTLSKSKITTTDDIESVYKKVISEYKNNNNDFEEDIKSSVMIASWIGFDGEDIFFRTGTMSEKHFEKNLYCIGENYINIVYPGDYLNELDKVEELENKFELNVEEKDFFTILNYLLKIFNYISNNSNTVSTTCDIGIQILQADGIYKLKISGEVEELISLIETDNIGSKIEIISVMASS